MPFMQMSLAYELFRPTFSRHTQAVGIALLLGVLWVGALVGGNSSPVDSDFFPVAATPPVTVTTKAGKLDVPAYYFPNEAVGTDRYLGARGDDCGGSASATPPDYPKGWLRP